MRQQKNLPRRTVTAERLQALPLNNRWHRFRCWWAANYSIAAACLAISLLLIAATWLNITAGQAAQNYQTAVRARSGDVRQKLAKLGEISQQTGFREAEVIKLRAQLYETQRTITDPATPSLPPVQLGRQLNPAYREASQHQFAASLKKVQTALAQLVIFSEYQKTFQSIIGKSALTPAIQDKDSARRLHGAWVKAAKQLHELQTDNAELRAATEKMATDAGHVVAYLEKIASYYEASDREALQNSQEKLEKRLQTLRDRAGLLETERGKLHVRIAEAMVQLQQIH